MIFLQVNAISRDLTTHEWTFDTNCNRMRNPLSEDLPGRLYCDKLILAFGTRSEPNKPYIPGQELVDGQNIIHSVKLGDWCRRSLKIDVNYHYEPSVRPLWLNPG